MSEEYLNTPLDATEMVTEIIGSDYHPFPIPPEIMETVQHLRDLVRPVGDRYQFLTFKDCNQYGPTFLSDWEDSLMHLGGVCSAMDNASVDMEGDDGELIRALILGLEREILRQKGLWEWVRATLKFDPWISETACASPPGEEERPAPSKSSETPQPEEIDETVPYPRFLDELTTWTDKHRGLIRVLGTMSENLDHNSRLPVWSLADVLEGQMDELQELWEAQRPAESSDSE